MKTYKICIFQNNILVCLRQKIILIDLYVDHMKCAVSVHCKIKSQLNPKTFVKMK